MQKAVEVTPSRLFGDDLWPGRSNVVNFLVFPTDTNEVSDIRIGFNWSMTQDGKLSNQRVPVLVEPLVRGYGILESESSCNVSD